MIRGTGFGIGLCSSSVNEMDGISASVTMFERLVCRGCNARLFGPYIACSSSLSTSRSTLDAAEEVKLLPGVEGVEARRSARSISM